MLKRLDTVLTLILLLLCLSGCGGEPALPLRIGTFPWPGYEPLYLARDLGYLDAKAVHLVEYPTNNEVLRAFRNQAIDGIAITLDEVLLLDQDGFDPRVVLVMDISHGADAIVGRADMRTVKDLVGRRVAVVSGVMSAYVLSRALTLNGLKSSDVKVVRLEVNEHVAAFRRGEVDAAVTLEPVRSELLVAGASLLFDSTAIPGEVVDVLVVRAAYLEGNPKVVRELLDGWFRAVDYLTHQPQDAAARMAVHQQISGEQFLKSLDGLQIPSRAENLKMLGVKPPP
jgi:NitT/TauT family transport system substrate-binding protein